MLKHAQVFADIHEYNKFDFGHNFTLILKDFSFYLNLLDEGVDGIIIDVEVERFSITKEFKHVIKPNSISKDNPKILTAMEIKHVTNSIKNPELEDFLKDSSNIGRYEELFAKISGSTLLTLMVSREDLREFAEDGIISMEDEPRGFLYIDDIGGRYATVYTSEDRISSISTELNKYSQIVNFSQLTNYALNAGLDGIIINPNAENVMVSRDVLLEYWQILERFCNDSRLNTAIKHMFLIGEEA